MTAPDLTTTNEFLRTAVAAAVAADAEERERARRQKFEAFARALAHLYGLTIVEDFVAEQSDPVYRSTGELIDDLSRRHGLNVEAAVWDEERECWTLAAGHGILLQSWHTSDHQVAVALPAGIVADRPVALVVSSLAMLGRTIENYRRARGEHGGSQ